MKKFQGNFLKKLKESDDFDFSPVPKLGLADIHSFFSSYKDDSFDKKDKDNILKPSERDAGFQLHHINKPYNQKFKNKNNGRGHDKNDHKHNKDDEWNDFEARDITGSNNNQVNVNYGQSNTAFITISGYHYGDGFSLPNDLSRPNPRDISNAIFDQDSEVFNSSGLSNFLWIWGQFLDHDINLTAGGSEAYNIAIPQGDTYFDPYNTGAQAINFTRSAYVDGSGTSIDNPRLQVNEITAFIDASNVYGSTTEQAMALRGEGGKLKLGEGELLPMVIGDHGPEFLAGDERANENVALTSMHTVFAREHNYWVNKLSEKYPNYSAEELYQKAKSIVEAEIQHITYDEFLPTLLGEGALDKYKGYDPTIDPQIATEFATAAFRVGHTMLSSDILRMQEDGYESDYGHMTLQQAFFRPDIILQGGINDILRGAGSSYSQEVDSLIIDDVRNFLFGPPGSGGFDLVSLNIQRGRDHGLPDFNSVREAYGLDPLDSFEDLSNDSALTEKLASLYGDISNLDLWVGGLIENTFEDSLVGETFYTIIADQFTRLRDGDRFWYEARLDDDLVSLVQDTSLSDIIMRNTDLICLQDDLFDAKIRQGGDDSDNIIYGSDQDDLLIGFGGNDILYDSAGDDVFYGGEGNDIFVFDRNSSGDDVIRDFNVDEDSLDISDILAGITDLPGALYDFLFSTQTDEGLKIDVLNSESNGASDRDFIVLLEGVKNIDDVSFVEV